MSRPEVKVHVFDIAPEIPRDGLPIQMATAGIVHDLGNLIQVASAALNHLARDPSVSAAPTLGLAISGARTALERAGALVRQSISSARESRRESEYANVGACLAEIETLIRSAWDPKIRLEVRVRPDLPSVRCNRLGLQNAILNLVFNARDASPNGGLISIDTAVVFDGTSATQVDITTADNGVGMTAETIAFAFDPFFTTKTEGLGGVGLPMVKRFAEESGGSIDIQSAPGTGTTVRLRLPAMR
ncbi:ATP-binding protein [Mesorhizobium sp. B283B1A]|uniref:sensor histidine kinase n=1 Tax=Mesorhizobium TaxID=68287 RepID=UPI001CD16EB4|nr:MULTISPECIES: ATP-binding protein [Mesorhizobium]MCA0046194.1 ATP-binding protein [Mesorhizobium sp. B283B1A]UQS62880.1 ATP-binding protein [Mesorhizobium opportunistum]